ncbi:serine/threonine protein kinase [Linnemannia schmuckeri]|uniref:non-specific serine/threonine protein kinase n=1 Tax=Linnemannia schmuckeri TaxID=64567 RepID=A0A9P5S4B4_9FUNG|nr:serine/threonine protein kinase [Linnemannia schmuckeri]
MALRRFLAKQNPENIYHGENRYECKEPLGGGANGKCYRALLNGQEVALKIAYCRPTDKKAIITFKTELGVLKIVQHSHIVKYLDDFEVQDLKIIVLELCSGGSLQGKVLEYWKKHGHLGLPEKDVARWLGHVMDALTYLHEEMRLVHRDVKPENMVVTSTGLAKMCDFGYTFHLDTGLNNLPWGTPGYMAPELLNGKEYDNAIDVFSFGASMFFLLFGRCLKEEDLPMTSLKEISASAMAVLKDTLQSQPDERPSFLKLKEYDFFSRYQKEQTGKRAAERDNEYDVEEHPAKRTTVATASAEQRPSSPPGTFNVCNSSSSGSPSSGSPSSGTSKHTDELPAGACAGKHLPVQRRPVIVVPPLRAHDIQEDSDITTNNSEPDTETDEQSTSAPQGDEHIPMVTSSQLADSTSTSSSLTPRPVANAPQALSPAPTPGQPVESGPASETSEDSLSTTSSGCPPTLVIASAPNEINQTQTTVRQSDAASNKTGSASGRSESKDRAWLEIGGLKSGEFLKDLPLPFESNSQ